MKSAVSEATTPVGPVSIVVSGGAESIAKANSAGVASVLSNTSVAWTAKVWSPSVRLV